MEWAGRWTPAGPLYSDSMRALGGYPLARVRPAPRRLSSRAMRKSIFRSEAWLGMYLRGARARRIRPIRTNTQASRNTAHVLLRLRRATPWRRVAVNRRQARQSGSRCLPMPRIFPASGRPESPYRYGAEGGHRLVAPPVSTRRSGRRDGSRTTWPAPPRSRAEHRPGRTGVGPHL